MWESMCRLTGYMHEKNNAKPAASVIITDKVVLHIHFAKYCYNITISHCIKPLTNIYIPD